MNKIKAALIALCFTVMAAFTVVASTAAPANAGYPGGEVWHAGNDDGYVADIGIICDNGRTYWLAPGQGSPGLYCGDVNVIIVGYNQTVRCYNMLASWSWTTFYTGHNQIGNFATLNCYMQRPI